MPEPRAIVDALAAVHAAASADTPDNFLSIMHNWPDTKRIMKVAKAHADMMLDRAEAVFKAGDSVQTLAAVLLSPSSVVEFSEALKAVFHMLDCVPEESR